MHHKAGRQIKPRFQASDGFSLTPHVETEPLNGFYWLLVQLRVPFQVCNICEYLLLFFFLLKTGENWLAE